MDRAKQLEKQNLLMEKQKNDNSSGDSKIKSEDLKLLNPKKKCNCFFLF